MLKWDVGNSLAFNVHSVRLYFRTCTLPSAFGVSSSPCKCGPFANVLLKLSLSACVHFLVCNERRDQGGLAERSARGTLVAKMCVQLHVSCAMNAAEQLHPSLHFFLVLFVFVWGSQMASIFERDILDLRSSTSAISDYTVKMFSKGHWSLVRAFEPGVKFMMHSRTAAQLVSCARSFSNCLSPLPFSHCCARDSRWWMTRLLRTAAQASSLDLSLTVAVCAMACVCVFFPSLFPRSASEVVGGGSVARLNRLCVLPLCSKAELKKFSASE